LRWGVRRFLASVHRRPFWGAIGLLAYAALVTFPHENVQWVVNEIANRIKHRNLYLASAAITLLEGALMTLILARRLRAQPAR
jgi:hypothetical protein